MYIDYLRLYNYRNYERADINFSSGLNIIQGNNAQGKTNLIESIYISAIGKSFRTNKDSDLVKMGQEEAFIHINVKKKYADMSLDFRINKKSEKEVQINKRKLIKRSELFGGVQTVLFAPEDLKLIKEGPSQRRQFIDREISQININYYYLIVEYIKILNQRNQLLKKAYYKNSLLDTIFVWDEKIADIGSKIIIKRREFINKLKEISCEIHRKITENKEIFNIVYISNISKQNNDDYDKIYTEFKLLLKNNQQMDLKRGFTSVGPHRDDIKFFINDIDVRQFGSQGQQRTVVLSLKLSEIEIIKNEIKDTPILLLDDVMSELDEKRQKDLIESTKNIQTIITSTDTHFISNKKDIYFFNVKNGYVNKSLFI